MPTDLDDEAPAYDDACEGCNAPAHGRAPRVRAGALPRPFMRPRATPGLVWEGVQPPGVVLPPSRRICPL